jgi:hypothetical protein
MTLTLPSTALVSTATLILLFLLLTPCDASCLQEHGHDAINRKAQDPELPYL